MLVLYLLLAVFWLWIFIGTYEIAEEGGINLIE